MRVPWVLFLAIALLTVPAGQAKDRAPTTVVDLFDDMDVASITYTPVCGMEPNRASQFVVDATNQSFQFLEGQVTDDVQARQAYTGCGSARYEAGLPPGTDHIHVRFTADRGVNTQVTEFLVNFTQRVEVSFDGQPAIGFDYFEVESGSRPATVFDPPAFPVPAGALRVRVTWLFEDQGSSRAPRQILDGAGLANPVSSQTVNATIRNPVVEFSGAPLASQVDLDRQVQGSQEALHTRVRLMADTATMSSYAVNLRVEVDESLRLLEVVAPDGTHLRQFTSNPLAGTLGFQPYNPNGQLPLVEPRVDFYRATLPGEAVAAHGAGAYTFVFTKEVPLDAPTPLVVLALLVLALPFAMGVSAVRGVQAFRSQAFGLYKKAAGGLLLGVALTLAYYLAFVVQALLQREHVLMAHWPLPTRALLLYLNVLLAIAALAAFGLVGRHLHNITRPPRA